MDLTKTRHEEFVARSPRHQVNQAPSVRVTAERVDTSGSTTIEAELLNLSRNGVRLRLAVAVAVREPITVRIWDEASGLLLKRTATVQWRHAQEDGHWSVGCSFDKTIDWQTLGELFLSGLLSTSPPGSS
jgi:hypothetical protein